MTPDPHLLCAFKRRLLTKYLEQMNFLNASLRPNFLQILFYGPVLKYRQEMSYIAMAEHFDLLRLLL
jgi:hypothetical protein